MGRLNKYKKGIVRGFHHLMAINKDEISPDFDKIIALSVEDITTHIKENINIDGGIIV